jgi:hypothetical protein
MEKRKREVRMGAGPARKTKHGIRQTFGVMENELNQSRQCFNHACNNGTSVKILNTKTPMSFPYQQYPRYLVIHSECAHVYGGW